jgi:hypothetical protein
MIFEPGQREFHVRAPLVARLSGRVLNCLRQCQRIGKSASASVFEQGATHRRDTDAIPPRYRQRFLGIGRGAAQHLVKLATDPTMGNKMPPGVDIKGHFAPLFTVLPNGTLKGQKVNNTPVR